MSGLSAGWLLSQRHRVTIYEATDRIGGHVNTVDVGPIPIDVGFIVYNEATYPNLAALFHYLNVPTTPSDMSFAVSLDDGRLEYSGRGALALLAQPGNLLRPRFWCMIRDIVRFYRNAPKDAAELGPVSLGDYLDAERYGEAFRDDHLYPMAAAIWSTPAADVARYPAQSFIRFFENHGLLKLTRRPTWHTVAGGAQIYVQRLMSRFSGQVLTGRPVRTVRRGRDAVEIGDALGQYRRFDHVVIATHADQALAMLEDPSQQERRLLGSFRYGENDVVLHSDPRLMPRRQAAWSSWNYMTIDPTAASRAPSVTYWMNKLQRIPGADDLFVTLNAARQPRAATVIRRETYRHPTFDAAAIAAQRSLWSLQGKRQTWFSGSYFGAGFHEDGLQAGLAVAEALGNVRRPWIVADESSRIVMTQPPVTRSPLMEPV